MDWTRTYYEACYIAVVIWTGQGPAVRGCPVSVRCPVAPLWPLHTRALHLITPENVSRCCQMSLDISPQLRAYFFTYSWAINIFQTIKHSSEIEIFNRQLGCIQSMGQLLLKVHAIPSFAQLVFKARASSESSSLLWNFNLSTTLGPENIFLFVLQKVPREVWVGCGFCEEVSGRRNCFQRLGKHDLHLAVDFLRRAGAPRC